jgi:hypothetical protein
MAHPQATQLGQYLDNLIKEIRIEPPTIPTAVPTRKTMANVKAAPAAETHFIQWRLVNGGFAAEGKIQTAERMPAGMYRIEPLSQQHTGFVPVGAVLDDLVRIPHSATTLVVNEINNFWGLKAKFDQMGMIHKRGFLLYGPPGSGKSSTIALVAEDIINQDGIVLQMTRSSNTTSMLLKQLRAVEPNRKVVVVIEDLDQMIYDGDEKGVLALLDGENQIDNVVYIATTNYLKRLPGRIRNRPSRFDRLVNIGKPDYAYRLAYIQSRNLPIPGATVEAWAKDTEGMSVAHIKEVIVGTMCLGLPYEDVIARVRDMAVEADKEAEESAEMDE